MAWLLAPPLLVACGAGDAPSDERTSCVATALQQCAPASVEGIDVFDGQGTVDWAAVAASDAGPRVRFAFIKATQGTGNTQATFAANWAGARAAHVFRGAYHFFDPREDGVAQATHFLSVTGPPAAGDLPPMLDLECPDGDADCLGNGQSGATDPADIARRLRDWLGTVERATGRKAVVYTFTSYFASNRIDSAGLAGLAAYPLFLAYPTKAACFGVPLPWDRATLWQYTWTGRVDGIPAAVDRDRFLGTFADLGTFANGSRRPTESAASDAGADAVDPGRVQPFPGALPIPPDPLTRPDATAFPRPGAADCL